MRRLAVVVALAGCGRWGFAPESSVVDAAADARRGSIAFAQHANTMCASVTTCTLAFTQFVQPGDGIVVTTTFDGSADVTAISDTAGNAYKPAGVDVTWPVSPFRTSTWFATHAGATGVVGVTVQLSAPSGSFLFVYVDEYANAMAVADTSSATGQTGLAPSTGSHTVPAGGLIFGHAEAQGTPVGVGPDFTLRDNSYLNIEEDRLVTVDGSYDAQFTLDSPGEWIALMIVLR